MIITVLGKGGSGKSTIATLLAQYFLNKKTGVLAVDADHNMDLTYNLMGDKEYTKPYLSDSVADVKKHIGLAPYQTYQDAFVPEVVVKRFRWSDSFFETYVEHPQENLWMLSAGPQTNNVLYGQACSHSMASPLKIFLPLLDVQAEQVVCVDEKAGLDGVSTGIVTGATIGVVVCEPKLHSIKTAQEIVKLLNFYETPYICVGNKIHSEEDKTVLIQSGLGIEILFPALLSITAQDKTVEQPLAELHQKILTSHKTDQLERTVKKFKRNNEFELM